MHGEESLTSPLFPMGVPLGSYDAHKIVDIVNTLCRCQSLHCVLEIRANDGFLMSIDQCGAGRVDDLEPGECELWLLNLAGDRPLGRWETSQQHKYVPYPQLRWERNRKIEQGQVPPRAVCCGVDSEFELHELC